MKNGFGEFLRESKLTLFIAVPMMASQLSQMLMGVADTVMVGRIGVIPLAAASFATIIFTIAYVTGLGFQIPISILTSQANGRKDQPETGQILRHGLSIGILVGLTLAIAVTVVSFFLNHFGQENSVATLAAPFLRVLAWVLLPAMVEQGLKQFSEALQRPWLPMTIMLSAVALNVFLNWVLIYGNWGAPALGIVGAGWSTLFARWASVLTMLAFILLGQNYRSVLPRKWMTRLEVGRMVGMLKIGAPLSISLLLEVAAFGMAAMMMGWLGARSLAAHQIAMNFAATVFMLPLGLSFAARIRIGHAVGSGQSARLPVIGFSAMAMAVLIMGSSAVGLFVFRENVAGWFVKEPEVVAMASSLLLIGGIFQLFDGLQVVATGALNGLSDVRVPTFAAFVAYWMIALPLAYYLGFKRGFGGQGIWSALALGLGVAAFFGVIRFGIMSRRMAAIAGQRTGI